MPPKRSQPVPAPVPATRTTKPSKGTTTSLTVPSSKYSPETPELTPSSSTTPPSSFPASLARSSKKLTKAVRSGHGGHGHGGGKGTNKARLGMGPEAELSEDDDDDSEDCDEHDAVSVVDDGAVLGERVIEGVEGKSAPKSEVSMHTLLDNAKARPQHQNISRGYELLTSPASRLVIPFDSITSGGKLRKVQVGLAPSSPGFSDDIEWEWEDLCFEMDGVVPVKKAYADVVKA